MAEPLELLQGERAGSPCESIQGVSRLATQDMTEGVVCPFGATTTPNGQD